MATRLRLRKFSPIDRQFPIYEILDGDKVVFDVGRDDAGDYELAVHPTSSGWVLSLQEALALIGEATKLLAEE